MPTSDPNQTIRLLKQLAQGKAEAGADLLPLIYEELHRIAERLMHQQSSEHTLQPTALINEAWLKLVHVEDPDWKSREHFLRVAAKAMRCVLVDHARATSTIRRGEGRKPVPLEDNDAISRDEALRVLAVNEGIESLAVMDSDLAQIVELRFFGGLKNEEIADTMRISVRSVERGWKFARSWLKKQFSAFEEAANPHET
jgi:RNA polymerase sigma factor (TIGR02999 family)